MKAEKRQDLIRVLVYIGITFAVTWLYCLAILYPVILHGYFSIVFGSGTTPGLAALASIIIAILIVWCHRGNLQRISDRTERKLSFKKKPEVSAEGDDESKK